MYLPRRWNLPQPPVSAGPADQLAKRIKVAPLIAQILLNRGIDQPDDCQNFLRPNLKDLHEPALIPNLVLAAQRIAQAIQDREKIVIYGDYDVDGITATAILWHAIRQAGGDVSYYIPHRVEEGYGLNAEAVSQLCAEGARLIVTVDCGVTAIDAARIARQRSVDLIITDHHEWHGDELPDCAAIVHPRLGTADAASTYPNQYLCGAGVAFKLAWEIGKAVNGNQAKVSDEFRAFLMEAIALAALGTIADVVPLIGENRIIAAYGLGALKSSKLTGIQSLIASSGLDGQHLSSYHVGFMLAPRLNACGRMGHARLAVEMLTHADRSKADEIANYLEQQNRQRQGIERKIVEEAVAQALEQKYDSPDACAIVLGSKEWHPGVIGIVASRIVDRFHKPTIMIALGEQIGQGSGRSISGFHLGKALESCREHLEACGGHEMAAGLKIKPDKFEDFRQAFCHCVAASIDKSILTPSLYLDCEAELQHLSLAMVSDLRRLGPFGHGNRKPLLCCRGVTLADAPRRVGKTGSHLQLFVRQNGTNMKCIAFGFADAMLDKLKAGMTIDLAVEPQLNEWNGRTNVELQVRDIQIAG